MESPFASTFPAPKWKWIFTCLSETLVPPTFSQKGISFLGDESDEDSPVTVDLVTIDHCGATKTRQAALMQAKKRRILVGKRLSEKGF